MSVPRVLLIWNPVSTGATAESVGAVSVVGAAHLDLVARHTLGAGDATRIAEEGVAEGYDALFVLGGDGTANEVLNGAGNRLPIGVLPGGGTSVLARALGLSSDVGEAARQLCRAVHDGIVREVNVGTLNGRKFAFAAGIGIDAEIVQRVDERGRGGEGIEAKRPGDFWFFKETIELLRSGEYAEPRMRVDAGEDAFEAMTVFVANADPWSYAGPLPLRIAPDTDFERELELVAVVEPIKLATGVRRVASLLRGEDDDSVRRVLLERGRVVCHQPTPVQVDGELIGELTEVELGLEHGGARFLVPGEESD